MHENGINVFSFAQSQRLTGIVKRGGHSHAQGIRATDLRHKHEDDGASWYDISSEKGG